MDITSFWETIVNTLHDGLLVVDARGTILNVNPAAEILTGYKAEELVGQKLVMSMASPYSLMC